MDKLKIRKTREEGRRTKKFSCFLVGVIFCLLSSLILHPSSFVYASVPHLINYQGRLTDTNGVPLNGSYDLTFRLYDAESAGNLLWEEAHTGVVVQKGIFSIMLGSVTNLNLPFDTQYFLEIKVGNDVMSPRQRITSSAYAVKAERAEKIRADSEDVTDGYLSDKIDNSTIKLNTTTHQIYGVGSGGWNHVQAFTTSGTWTKPTGVTTAYVEVLGGGGGGGTSGGAGGGGGGGGAGGYSAKICTVTGDVSVTVGAAGTVLGNGGNSSFGSFCSATGGNAGASTSSGYGGTGGNGGSGSGGDLNISGGVGMGGQGDAGGTGGLGGSSHFGNAPAYGGGGRGAKPLTGEGQGGGSGLVVVWWNE